MVAEPQPPSRRERARAATIEEILRTAVGQMREHGTTDLRFTDIARAMGMTPPALYRYFADRDELLSALIAQAYDDLGAAVAQARAGAGPGSAWEHWSAVSRAFRDWAGNDQQRFALIFGLPVPGYTAPEDGPTTEAAMRAMQQLVLLFVEAARAGELRPPLLRAVDPAIAAVAAAKHPGLASVLPPESYQAMLHLWASLHGYVSLEANGHFAWIDDEAREALFAGQMRLAAAAAGLPTPD